MLLGVLFLGFTKLFVINLLEQLFPGRYADKLVRRLYISLKRRFANMMMTRSQRRRQVHSLGELSANIFLANHLVNALIVSETSSSKGSSSK